MKTKTLGYMTAGLIFSALILAVSVTMNFSSLKVYAQDTTQQQQTIDAMIHQRFTQTAQAVQQIGATQTVNAVLYQAQTATAAFQNTVDAQFNQAVAATSNANFPQQNCLDENTHDFCFRTPATWQIQRAKNNNAAMLAFNGSGPIPNLMGNLKNLPPLVSGQILMAFVSADSFSPDSNPLQLANLVLPSLLPLTFSPPTLITINGFNAAEATSQASSSGQILFVLLQLKTIEVVVFIEVAPGELDADRPLTEAIIGTIQQAMPDPSVVVTATSGSVSDGSNGTGLLNQPASVQTQTAIDLQELHRALDSRIPLWKSFVGSNREQQISASDAGMGNDNNIQNIIYGSCGTNFYVFVIDKGTPTNAGTATASGYVYTDAISPVICHPTEYEVTDSENDGGGYWYVYVR